jgi:acetyl esterase/lipase
VKALTEKSGVNGLEKFTLRKEDDLTTVCYYPPEKKKTDIGIVIFPGGGYRNLAKHEGEAYARRFNDWGIAAFVVEYRVFPHHFPSQLLDARDAICFVRSNAERFGINKEKILAMGSSAGGHLVSLLCNYHQAIHTDKSVQKEEYLPNGQILCYPVISSRAGIEHQRSFQALLGDLYETKDEYSPEVLVDKDTPPAFIWHTAEDKTVSYLNSIAYANALIKKDIDCELHIFPNGEHGLGLALSDPHVAQWMDLLRNWLKKFY